jgi:diguanylate cyclase (GGDEF)-like protein/PAS domain S-box-containing protein
MYLLLLAVSGAASAVLAVVAWPHRRHRGFGHFVALEAATAWWVLCYLGEQLDVSHARLWFALKFQAIGLIPPSWLLFSLHHVGRPPRSRWWQLLYVWPLLLGPLVLTNDWHHWYFREIVAGRELVGLNGPLYPFHLLLNYAYTFIAAVLLFGDWRRRGRVQSAVLGAGSILPWGANVLTEIGKVSPAAAAWLPVNPTLPGFALSAIVVGYAVLRYRLLDPRPVALDMLFQSMPDPVIVLNQSGLIVDANYAAANLLGGTDRRLPGKAWREVVAGAEGWNELPESRAGRVERFWQVANTTRWFELQQRRLYDRHDRLVGALIVLRDVTSRKALEEQLRRESYSDQLTGLSNRRYFQDECARLKGSREFPVAVVTFDLDGLKAVNDSLGHASGDQLLQTMAAFLRQFFRGGDRIYRLGGDEFAALLPSTSAAELQAVAIRLPASLALFNRTSPMPLRFSSGWTIVEHPEGLEAGLREADAMLYREKRANAAS